MDIEHISVSRKQCFDQCEQAYKYRYHLKVIPSRPEPIYFTYGKVVHRAAELYVKNGGRLAISQIASDLLKGEIVLEHGAPTPQLPLEYKTKLPDHLRAIKSLCDRIGCDGHTEYGFRFDLDPPHGRYIKGVIDRLIVRGDKYFILDYKTSKKNAWRKDASTISEDLQLRCYGRVVQREFGVVPENIKAALFYVEGSELVATKFSQKSLETAERDLLETYRQIEATNPDNVWGKTGYHCQRCEYNDICPFFMS